MTSLLTKKQLYGYSIMKWDIVRNRLKKVLFGYCSFCFTAIKEQERDKRNDFNMCYYCQIDKTICNSHGIDSLYSANSKTNREFHHLVNEMCNKLTERYNNEE